MNYLLIRYKDNWADEMDIEGFVIADAAQWYEDVNKVKAWFTRDRREWEDGKSITFHVGTNEEIKYTNFEQWYSCFLVSSISDELAESITEMFGDSGYKRYKASFGSVFTPLDILEKVTENDEYEDNEENNGV